MNIVVTDALSETQKAAIYKLWNEEYPAQLAYAQMSELENYLLPLANARHYFAMYEPGSIAGWAFVFTRHEQRWFAIIVDGASQGWGVGWKLLHKLMNDEQELNGWVTDHDGYKRADGLPYLSPIGFYTKAGFSVVAGHRLETDKLSAAAIKWSRSIK